MKNCIVVQNEDKAIVAAILLEGKINKSVHAEFVEKLCMALESAYDDTAYVTISIEELKSIFSSIKPIELEITIGSDEQEVYNENNASLCSTAFLT